PGARVASITQIEYLYGPTSTAEVHGSARIKSNEASSARDCVQAQASSASQGCRDGSGTRHQSRWEQVGIPAKHKLGLPRARCSICKCARDRPVGAVRLELAIDLRVVPDRVKSGQLQHPGELRRPVVQLIDAKSTQEHRRSDGAK